MSATPGSTDNAQNLEFAHGGAGHKHPLRVTGRFRRREAVPEGFNQQQVVGQHSLQAIAVSKCKFHPQPGGLGPRQELVPFRGKRRPLQISNKTNGL